MDSQTTNSRERVDVAEGVEPAAANQDPAEAKAVLSLKQRLAAIRDECAGITKDDIKMGNFTIKGHTFEAILSEVRPLLHRHGVDIEPTLVERTYNGNRCDVLVDFAFERTDDSDERRVIRWGGAGTDNGDKAFSKAGTNAVKEMLKKRFLISDRDDAKEEEDKVEHKTEGQVSAAVLEAAQEAARAAIEQWGKSFRSALLNARSKKEVERLATENRAQLTDENLPAVTRQFFFDLIEQRKKEASE